MKVPPVNVLESEEPESGSGPKSDSGTYCSEDAESSLHAMQRHRLIQLQHAVKCSKGEGECSISPFCWKLKLLWRHVLICKNDYCKVPLCTSSRFILHHYGHCSEPNCEVCVPVKETYKRVHSDEEERALLKEPPKRMRVSRSQPNLFIPGRKSNSFDEGREQRTRIIRDSDIAPIISKFDVLAINNMSEAIGFGIPAVLEQQINN